MLQGLSEEYLHSGLARLPAQAGLNLSLRFPAESAATLVVHQIVRGNR